MPPTRSVCFGNGILVADIHNEGNRIVALARNRIKEPRQLVDIMRAAISEREPLMKRLSVRGFSDRRLYRTFPVEGFLFQPEAMFELGGETFCFWGWNETPVDANMERLGVEKLLARHKGKEKREVLASIGRKGYSLEILDGVDMKTAASLAELYARHIVAYNKPLDADSLRDLVNGGSRVVIARKDGGIVGSLFGICKTYDADGTRYFTIELDNALVDGNHQNAGLTLGAAFLIEQGLDPVVKQHGMIYAEASARCVAVNICCIEFGMGFAGTMPAHSIMQVKGEYRRDGNENIWYKVLG